MNFYNNMANIVQPGRHRHGTCTKRSDQGVVAKLTN